MLKLTIPIPRLLGPRDIICSKGALAAMNSFIATRVVVIATKRASSTEPVQKLLNGPKSNRYHLVTPSWTGEPTIEALAGTIKDLELIKPDCILAIGGGSVIDGAKLCWAFYEHANLDRDRLSIPFALPALRTRSKFVVAPTTSGTGSEASSSAIYLDNESGSKVPVVSHDFLPDLAILDPLLTVDLPKEISVITALDALAHAIEGYTSKQTNLLVDGMAETSVRWIIESLNELLETPDILKHRERLMIAALYSGYVQNMRLVGAAHAIAHQLGENNIPHGLATGLLLPKVMRLNCRDKNTRNNYLKLGRTAGFAEEEELIKTIEEMPGKFGVGSKISDWKTVSDGIGGNFIGEIAEKASNDALARYFPVELTKSELGDLLRSVW